VRNPDTEEDEMARIPAVATEQAGVIGRLLYRMAERRFGAVPEPFAVMAHHRRLLRAGAIAETAYARAATVLPSALRELAVYRVATVVGCSWCVDFGAMLQRLHGLDVERLAHIDDYPSSPHYSEPERLALAYADAMTAQPTTVDDAQVAELDAVLGRAGLVELTHVIALENMRARFNHALGITDQGFDTACAVRPAAGSASRG
jgi:AhpD family alkylhydroperoxidase